MLYCGNKQQHCIKGCMPQVLAKALPHYSNKKQATYVGNTFQVGGTRFEKAF
jgi:hypothetical protein